jgi:hypothetical protein
LSRAQQDSAGGTAKGRTTQVWRSRDSSADVRGRRDDTCWWSRRQHLAFRRCHSHGPTREVRDRAADSTQDGITSDVSPPLFVGENKFRRNGFGVMMVVRPDNRLVRCDVAMGHAAVVVCRRVVGAGVQVDERRGHTANLHAQAHEEDEAQTFHVTTSVTHDELSRQGLCSRGPTTLDEGRAGDTFEREGHRFEVVDNRGTCRRAAADETRWATPRGFLTRALSPVWSGAKSNPAGLTITRISGNSAMQLPSIPGGDATPSPLDEIAPKTLKTGTVSAVPK